jgi:hypothetical protein
LWSHGEPASSVVQLSQEQQPSQRHGQRASRLPFAFAPPRFIFVFFSSFRSDGKKHFHQSAYFTFAWIGNAKECFFAQPAKKWKKWKREKIRYTKF